MAYTKHNFQPGEILKASQMNEIDEGIAKALEGLENVAEAEKWGTAEAFGVQVAAGEQPTVNVQNVGDKKVLIFGIPEGAPGPTPTITFEVETGEPGTSVQVEQSGTAENPIVKLTIPRGTPGESGATLVVDDEGNGTIT